MNFLAQFAYLFLLIGSSLAVYVALARLLRWKASDHAFGVVVSLGLGPIMISWLLKWAMMAAPGQSDSFYVATIALAFVGLAVYGKKEWAGLVEMTQRIWATFRTTNWFSRWHEVLLVVVAVVALTATTYLALSKPLFLNDPLEYATVGRLIHERGTPTAYPFPDSDPETGVYLPMPHPLGYPMLMTSTYLLEGNTQDMVLLRTIAPFYTACTLVLIGFLLGRRAGFGMLLFMSVPYVCATTVGCHIDPMRIHTFFLAFVVLWRLIQNESLPNVVLTGMAVGASMFTHPIGILSLVFIPPMYVLLGRYRWNLRLQSALAIGLVAIVIGGHRFAYNTIHFNSPITVSQGSIVPPAKTQPQAWQASNEAVTRQVNTPRERFLFGYVNGFTKPFSFGFTYWFLVLAIPALWRAERRSLPRILLYGTFGFYGVLTILFVLGSDVATLNDRYPLTVQPLICIMAALALFRVMHDSASAPPTKPSRHKGVWFIVAGVLACSPNLFLFATSQRSMSQAEDVAWDGSRLRANVRETMHRIRKHVDPASTVLVFRQSDFAAYTQRKTAHYDAPSTVEVRRALTPERAFEVLHELNIRYVLLPNHASMRYMGVQAMCGDPKYATLLFSERGHRLHRVNDVETPVSISSTVIATDHLVMPPMWNHPRFRNMPERTPSFREILGIQKIPGNWEGDWSKAPLVTSNERDRLLIYTDTEDPLVAPPHAEQSPLESSAWYRATLRLSGSGHVSIYLLEFDDRHLLERHLIFDGILLPDAHDIHGQLRTMPTARSFRFALTLNGKGKLRLHQLRLENLALRQR
jgi:hypothetical protein